MHGTIEMPGNNGGSNWGGAAVDPSNGTLYVVSKDVPCLLKLVPERDRRPNPADPPEKQGQFLYESNCQWCHLGDRKGEPPATPSLAAVTDKVTGEQIRKIVQYGQGSMPAFPKLSKTDLDALLAYLATPAGDAGAKAVDASATRATRYVSGFGFMFSKNGLPAIGPPWTQLTAYDLNEGIIKWKIPLGEAPELATRGIRNTGTIYPKLGPVVTAGGLIFTATRDRMVRALDEETGKVLWEMQLDSAMEGIPAVYEIDGREYLVVCAAAPSQRSPAPQGKTQGAYVAFALP
jgi:quinoprotein glucose dehydrogenase